LLSSRNPGAHQDILELGARNCNSEEITGLAGSGGEIGGESGRERPSGESRLLLLDVESDETFDGGEQARTWSAGGYRVDDVNQAAKRIRFAKL